MLILATDSCPSAPLAGFPGIAMDHSHDQPHQPHQPRRGDASKPVRYNPVPIGGPDRPPLTQSPSPSTGTGTIYASSPGRRSTHTGHADRRHHSLTTTTLASPDIKQEHAAREGSDYQSEPPSAVTAYTERSSTVYPESGGNGVKSEDGDDGPQKKRQKRNKPTLSCFECVERKTKVGIGMVVVVGT